MEPRPHVLLYTDDPGAGGVAQYNHALLCHLAGRGFHLTCAQSRLDTPLLREQADRGIRHRWLPIDTLTDFDSQRDDDVSPRNLFLEERPDLVLFSDGCPFSQLAARRAACRLGLPFVAVEGLVEERMARHFAALLVEVAAQFGRAREVVAVSRHNLDLLRRRYGLAPSKGQVIPYGRPDRFFNPTDPAVRSRVRAELGVPDGDVLCLTLGRLELIKGHRYLLEAVRLVQASPAGRRLHFAWVGIGRLGKSLTEEVAGLPEPSRVHLPGQSWDAERWLDAADAFILPSEAEGMPLAVMEAMAKGLPVAATAVGGVPEELGDTGELLPAPADGTEQTTRAMAEVLAVWATDAERRRSVGWACRARADALFRQDRMLAATDAVVDRALLPEGDYVSPGFAVVRPDACFPLLTSADPRGHPWPHLRGWVPHRWRVDRRWPLVGLLSRDEAHIYYHNARAFRGRRALEVGGYVGWSTCHLALAGVELDVVDPLLDRDEFRAGVERSLEAAGVRQRVRLHGGFSPAGVRELSAREGRRWGLIVIDGNHDGDAPLEDATVAEEVAEADALILFHDLAAPAVARGWDYLRQRGWQAAIYQTMQIIGAAWRGTARPVKHQPDPEVAWRLPEHLRGADLLRASDVPEAEPRGK
jgi:glycosyltransferase involved in cell wall biosynthesis/predicted O-methyltransferase YrrM